MGCHVASPEGADAERSAGGLKLRAFENGSMQLTCEMSGQRFECMVDKRLAVHVTRLPLAMAWALREDIENSSLEEALEKLAKRLEAYTYCSSSRFENTERKHSLHLQRRKFETAGSYSFIRADLALNFGDYGGVLRLDMWYGDFSVRPQRADVKCRGPFEFIALVSDKADDIQELLQSLPLEEACDVLCTTD